MAVSPMFPQQSRGLQMLYSALDYQQQERLRKEAEEERKRQLEEQRRQQREANKHSAFGDTLKLIGTVGGATIGSFTPVGPVGGAAIGSTLADATMAFAPNVGGTQPGADNPYYTPTTDTQKALTAVNAGLQFYSAYEADKIAKERALAAADAKARSAEKLRTTDFQTAQSYVTSGFDEKVTGSRPFESTTMPSLARDLKDSGKYSFLKDEDFLMIAAGEADNYYKFGPTLDTLTLQGTELLYRALEQEGTTAQSVLADLDAGEASWAKEFKRLPLPAQTAAKSELMKQSRATLAAANTALKEKAAETANIFNERANDAVKRLNERVDDIVTSDNLDGVVLPAGVTLADLQGSEWASDPQKVRALLGYTGTGDDMVQYMAMKQILGAGRDTEILAVFPEETRNILQGKAITLGIASPESMSEKPTAEVGEGDLTKQVDAQNNSVQAETSTGEQPASDTSQRQVELLSEKETAQAQATEISNKQLLGLGSSLYSEENNVNSGAPVESTRYEKTRENYVARQEAKKEEDQTELAAEYLREQTVNPNAAVVAPKRKGGRPVNLPPEEARANFEAEKEARKSRSRRPGLAAEYQRDLALGEAANEDPPPPLPPESNINQMYEDQSVQKEQQASIADAQTPLSPSVTNLISESMDNAKLALGRKPGPAPAANLTALRAPEVPRPPLAQEDIAYAEPDPEPRNPEDDERVDPALRESRVEALNVVKELNNAFTDLRQKVENSMGQDFDSLNELSPVELRYELNAKQREIDNLTTRFDELESGPLVTKEASGEELTEALREYDDIRRSGGRILTELRLMQGERLADPVIENKVKILTERYPELSNAKGGVARRDSAKAYYETEMRLAGGLNGMLSEINNRLAETDMFAKAGRIEQAQLEYAKAMHLIEEGLDKYRGANYGEN
jgi:hypothetical protein